MSDEDPYGRPPPPGFWQAPIPTSRPSSGTFGKWQLLSLVAAGAIVVGSLLPWAEVSAVLVGQLSVAGTDGDGILTLILGAIVGVLAITGNKTAAILAFLGCIAILGIAVYDMANLADTISDVDQRYARVSIGSGLWLVAIGSALGIISTLGSARHSG